MRATPTSCSCRRPIRRSSPAPSRSPGSVRTIAGRRRSSRAARSGTACWTAISSCGATATPPSARTCAVTRSRRCVTWRIRCAREGSRAFAAVWSLRPRPSPTPHSASAGRGTISTSRPVRATTAPASTYPPLLVRATTVGRSVAPADSAGNRPKLSAGYDSSHTGVLVTGTIAVGDTAVLELAQRDLRGAYVAALREALRSRGVRIDEARRDSTASLDSLLAMHSPPLRDVLPALQKPSQNQIAELLLKTVASRVTGAGRADSGRRVVEAQLVAWGAEPDGFAVRDGSGLSRHDYTTPRTLVKVLDAMRRHQDFKVYYDALPIA